MQITPFACKLVIRANQWRVIQRSCHNQNSNNNNSASNAVTKDVRVRFAPSPTGYLHLGGIRTALYNYLFARANNGRFIVRIEDTDQTRLIPGATKKIFDDLEWVGISPDESVVHGGNHGPYVQSKRLDLYRSELQKLLENGTAYRCFCTERRLELLRKQAIKLQQKQGYDNRCRHLNAEQVAEKLANETPHCFRFKLSSDINGLDDMIYGRVDYDVHNNESDPVIMKSDGYPTYHFANVVDDHFMEITHVLRGVEWQISTPKHLQMYRAFGWTPPQFAHMPLLLTRGGKKLSKRQNDINIDYYQSKNVFPQALINFMIHTGGGFAKNDDAKTVSPSMKELVEMFNISLVRPFSGRLDSDHLNECNRLELNRQINDPEKCDQLIEQVQNIVRQHYPIENSSTDIEKEHIRHVLHWAIGQRIHSLDQLVVGDLSFLWVQPNVTKSALDIPNDVLDALSAQLQTAVYKNEQLLVLLKEFAAKHNLKFGKFMQTLRARLSGVPDGPKIGEMMEILGPKLTIQRIRAGAGRADDHNRSHEKIDTA